MDSYSSYYTTTGPINSSSNASGIVAAILGALATFGILILVVCVLIIIGRWKTFEKAGRKGYESLIAGHNLYVILDMAGLPGYWYFLLLLGAIPFAGWAVVVGLNIWWSIELAKSFGKSAGYGVLLAIFPFVMWPVLGFSKAEYIGPQSSDAAAPVTNQGVYYSQPVAQATQPAQVIPGTTPVQPAQPTVAQPTPVQPVQPDNKQ